MAVVGAAVVKLGCMSGLGDDAFELPWAAELGMVTFPPQLQLTDFPAAAEGALNFFPQLGQVNEIVGAGGILISL